MDWPTDLIPYRCDFYLQNRTTQFRSPLTGTRQVLRRQGERWICTASFRFGAVSNADRLLAQRMDVTLAKLYGARETVNLWDFARPSPLGAFTVDTSLPAVLFTTPGSPGGLSYFTTGSPQVLTTFVGGAGIQVANGADAGDETVMLRGFLQNDTPGYAGDYLELGGFLYMLLEDLEADAVGMAVASLNRPLVASVADGVVPVFTRASTPMQLIDDDQPNRSVDVNRVYEYTLSFVEAFF